MNEKFMFAAIKEAKKAYNIGEVPVGAIIVKNNKIIARAFNKIEITNDSTNHAEILAIKKASKKINNWRLVDCDLYVTLEPCEMCKGAIINSRIKNIYYLISKTVEKNNKAIYKKVDFEEKEYLKILQNFFKEKRG